MKNLKAKRTIQARRAGKEMSDSYKEMFNRTIEFNKLNIFPKLRKES